MKTPPIWTMSCENEVLDNLASLGVTMGAVTHDPRVAAHADRRVRL